MHMHTYIFVSVLNVIFSVPFIGRFVDLVLTFLATVVRLGAGNYVASNIRECKRPKKMLQLYEYEGCPFCRRVRETLTILDLDAEIFPTPRETFKKYGFKINVHSIPISRLYKKSSNIMKWLILLDIARMNCFSLLPRA